MKKIIVGLLALFMLNSIQALDMDNGLTIGGGVKTGLEVKNRDYGGKLGDAAPGEELSPTLYFASHENESRNGEGWFTLDYSSPQEDWGSWGLRLGAWAHGNLEKFDDVLHLGDHYLWANFLDDRLQFKGGQGGGTPITSGGWINADWLSYTGLRLFWVDPAGFAVGINFPAPEEDIKPVNYLSTVMIGALYKPGNFWLSLQFDNSPIYDDSEANYYGGLHRRADQEPIAEAGNVAFGIGVDNLYGGKGLLAFDGLVTNLGKDELKGVGSYKITPVETILALKTGYPFTDEVYAELKGKYTISQGDNEDNTASAYWGKMEFEPYVHYQAFDFLRFHLSIYGALYINSYYLDQDVLGVTKGQVAGYSSLLDYLSAYYITFKPGATFSFGGAEVVLGYEGGFSRDHVENTVYVDLRWSF
jgi:hypothetical protein